MASAGPTHECLRAIVGKLPPLPPFPLPLTPALLPAPVSSSSPAGLGRRLALGDFVSPIFLCRRPVSVSPPLEVDKDEDEEEEEEEDVFGVRESA